MKTKLIAMYLPQYHIIPENDEFWGKGFTDWTTVKNAEPLFSGHRQPRRPLNDNYYDLSLESSIVWQQKLAKEYGVYGFAIYHYWFNNEKNLLTKPSQIILNNSNIDINFCFSWDNISWKRSWSNIKENGNAWAPSVDLSRGVNNGPSILIPYVLGEEKDWLNHYKYLRAFFLDKRYIKVNNKPVFLIFHYDNKICEMAEYWSKLSIKDGFDGIFFIYRYVRTNDLNAYTFKYEPQFSAWSDPQFTDKLRNRILKFVSNNSRPKEFDYDRVWKTILYNARKMNDKTVFPGAFVSYDDTPRRGSGGTIIKNATKEKFEKYLRELIDISTLQNKEFVFLTAWNEWGEGAYLEPDTVDKFDYLNSIKNVMINR